MDETVLKVAIAGMLHDIGKFAERAGMDVSQDYRDRNAQQYQHYNVTEKRHTHQHALFTAAFVEQLTDSLPRQFNSPGWGEGDCLINLAAAHHKPETPLQWIVSEADRLSSGLDRQQFDGVGSGIKIRDYRKTRLIPIAEQMLRGGDFYKTDNHDSYKWRYRLAEISPDNTFPLPRKEAESADDSVARQEYEALFEKCTNSLGQLEQKENLALWFEHFESLLQVYASCIPAATVGNVIPDVSLYDHSKATSALAAALYLWHKDNDSMNANAIKDEQQEKFLLVNGDFFGIQSFIFTDGGESNRGAAKLLRGRSFVVSLLTELAADMLCREIGIPASSIILNAAGKFSIIAPNSKAANDAVMKVEAEINRWLIEHFHGETSFGFSTVTASGSEFKMGGFANLWGKLGRAGESKKYRKFDLNSYAGVVSGYLDSFDNDLGICPYCGKRPAEAATKNDGMLGEGKASCSICRDHIMIGARLVKGERLAIYQADARFPGMRLKQPLFGRYQLSFDQEAGKESIGGLLKLWHIGAIGRQIPAAVTVKYFSGYVPTVDKDGTVKTFEEIALAARNHSQNEPGKESGIEALGILKADVDNLGKIFACGLPKERLNLSRLSTFSRQMNGYFSLYLPWLFATESNFQNIYTVFAGGDDLFLVAPWNRAIEFAGVLKKSFEKFVCANGNITISAGIVVHKPGTPVPALAEQAEEALEAAKGNNRNSITLFGETVKWSEFTELDAIRRTLAQWQEKNYINNAMLYRMNDLIAMAKQENNLRKPGMMIDIQDMECLKWRSRFTYSVTRNIGKGLNKDERTAAMEEIKNKGALWLETYEGKLKIALWQILYNQR